MGRSVFRVLGALSKRSLGVPLGRNRVSGVGDGFGWGRNHAIVWYLNTLLGHGFDFQEKLLWKKRVCQMHICVVMYWICTTQKSNLN